MPSRTRAEVLFNSSGAKGRGQRETGVCVVNTTCDATRRVASFDAHALALHSGSE
jgi:hypothetical protein